MEYFSKNYLSMQYPLADEENLGLRNAQIGAIHALGAYFTTKTEPVLISMPTGTGKTAVIMMVPYLLRATKVLLITPTILVRSQITTDFFELQVLKKIGVFSNDIKPPNVYEMTKLYTDEQNEKIQNADVIISTPQCALPLSEDNSIISLFDLVIIDEAHHEPAKTWRTILTNMPNTKQILFTATPFRRDKKAIKANHIFNYPLSQAYKDGVFGDIKYIPVEVRSEVEKDCILAKKGEEIFIRDRKKGFEHAVMVRCKSKRDAKRLFSLYTKETNLKLKVVDSSKTRKEVLGIIDDLKNQKIDGVLCVDMMAEGFDFPNLKIAIIHHPHKTLATTLQFIGRFARTNTEKKIGAASFIAVNDEELLIENKKLFSSDSIWQDILVDLTEEKITRDIEEKQYIKNYDNKLKQTNNQEFSLHSINTNFHARIYYSTLFNLQADFPDMGMKVENIWTNPDDQTVVVVTSVKQLPRWSTADGTYLDNEYNTFIIHYQEKNKLLFINSHIKSESIYDAIATAYCGKKNFEKITMSNIHKVLSGVKNHEIFNSGLANRLSEGETYKISSGSDVSKAIDADSGKMYSPGHVFCKAEEADTQITIGYSSGSKIWSSKYGNVQEMIKWFDLNGEKISNKKTVVQTNTNYDYIPMPTELITFPDDIFMFDFNQKSYSNPHQLLDGEGFSNGETILDLEVLIESVEASNITLKISLNNYTYYLTRSIDGKYTSSTVDELLVSFGRLNVPLSDYFNECPLSFYTSSLDMIFGNEISRYDYELPVFNLDKVISIDWNDYNTDISMEVKSKSYKGSKNSIQETIEKILLDNDEFNYVIFDHGAGEIADYLTISVLKDKINVALYHVKGKSSVNFNSSVTDMYEVLGQSIKSLIWIKNKKTLLSKIRNRQRSNHGFFLKGNIKDLEVEFEKNIPLRGKIVACQPSLTGKSHMPDKIDELLSATNMKIKNSAVANEFLIWGS